MKKYTVKFKMSAYYTVNIDAKTPDEARKLAEEAFADADFGKAEQIDGELIKCKEVEPENWNGEAINPDKNDNEDEICRIWIEASEERAKALSLLEAADIDVDLDLGNRIMYSRTSASDVYRILEESGLDFDEI